MSDLKIGDRVRAKHDHTFEGEVAHVWDDVWVSLDFPAGEGPNSRYRSRIKASWLEPVPKPLNPLVPWDVLLAEVPSIYDSFGNRVPFEKTLLGHRLRERGYGPAEETR